MIDADRPYQGMAAGEESVPGTSPQQSAGIRRIPAAGAVILALATASLLAAAFPNASLWPLAWIGLGPLVAALSGRSWWSGALLGMAAGLAFMGVVLWWSAVFGLDVWVLLVLFQAGWWGLFGAGAAWLLRGEAGAPWWRPAAAAAWWTLVEVMRASGPLALTWGELSYTQVPVPAVIQIADLCGASGVSFLLALSGCTVAECALVQWARTSRNVGRSARAAGALLAVLVAGDLLYGAARLSQPPPPARTHLTVTCVQPSFPMTERVLTAIGERDLVRLEQATRRSATPGGLVVWPETAIPVSALETPYVLDRIRLLARQTRASILVGCPDRDARGSYNAAFLMDAQGRTGERYRKIRLVPFGEYLPWSGLLRPFHAFDRVNHLRPGDHLVRFAVDGVRVSPLICFESTFSDMAREEVGRGANLLVVVTNDTWFERTSAAAHHLAMSALRAVEDRVWLVQCANSGISAFVDPRGHIHDATPLFQVCEVTRTLAVTKPGSFYQRTGDWLIGMLAAVLLAAVAARARAAKRAVACS